MKIILLIFITISLYASYDMGKKVFDKKCASCHVEFIQTDKLIKNIISKNKVLNLKAPTFNRLVHKILHGKKAVVSDIDMDFVKKQDIAEYLEDYLTFPRFSISVSNVRSRKLYPKKKSLRGKITPTEYSNLVDYIFEYEKHFVPVVKKKKVKLNEKALLKKAKKKKKKILIEAVTRKCFTCKHMKKKVLSNILVKKELKKNYIYKKVYIDKNKLPFNLDEQCNKIVPSYFILDSNGKLEFIVRSKKTKKEFLNILRTHNK